MWMNKWSEALGVEIKNLSDPIPQKFNRTKKSCHLTLFPSCKTNRTPKSHFFFFIFRLLTFCYLAALNCWLLLCPATLSHDWQMGSVPLVTSIIDVRNFATCLFFGACLVITYRAFTDIEVRIHPFYLFILVFIIIFCFFIFDSSSLWFIFLRKNFVNPSQVWQFSCKNKQELLLYRIRGNFRRISSSNCANSKCFEIDVRKLRLTLFASVE